MHAIGLSAALSTDVCAEHGRKIDDINRCMESNAYRNYVLQLSHIMRKM